MRRASLVVALLGLLVVLAAAVVGCSGDGDPPAAPTAATPSVDAVAQSIVTSDGMRLSAHLFEAAASGGRIAILSHQYGAEQSSWYAAAERLQALGVSALTFDFRGFGQSGGEEDPETLVTDLDAALAYARERGYGHILLVGASMGGTASIVVAGTGGESAVGVEGVIALSAPVEFGALRAEEAASALAVPLLLVAADGDTSASDSLQRLGDAARAPSSSRLVVASAAHGTELLDTPEASAIWDVISRFIDALWPDSGAPTSSGAAGP